MTDVVRCSGEIGMEFYYATSMDRGVDWWDLIFLGMVTVRTPCETLAFTPSTFVFSGSRKRRRNLLCALSNRCHLSFLSTSSLQRSPVICNVLPSSTETFTSSFVKPVIKTTRPHELMNFRSSNNCINYRKTIRKKEKRSCRFCACDAMNGLIYVWPIHGLGFRQEACIRLMPTFVDKFNWV